MISSYIKVWRAQHSFPLGEELVASAARTVDESTRDAGSHVAGIVADAVLRVFAGGDFSGESSPVVYPPLRKRLEQQNEAQQPATPGAAPVVIVERPSCSGLCVPAPRTRLGLRQTAKIAPAPLPSSPAASRAPSPLRLSRLSAPAHVPDVPFASTTLEAFLCSVVAALGVLVVRGSVLGTGNAALIESTVSALDALRAVGGAVDGAPRGTDVMADALAHAATFSDDSAVAALRRGATPTAALSPRASLCAIGHILRHAAALAATPVLAFSPVLALRAAAASSLARDAPPSIARAARVPPLVAAATALLCRPSVRGGDAASSPVSAGFSIAVLAALAGAWPPSSPLPVALDGDLPVADLLRVFGGAVKCVVLRGLCAPLPRCRTNVHRHSVLADAADALARPGLVFPRFYRVASSDDEYCGVINSRPASARSSADAHPPLHSATPSKIVFSVDREPTATATLEDGEGHGPRKELFHSVGVAATDAFGPAEALPSATLGAVDGADLDAPILTVKAATTLSGVLPGVAAWFSARLDISSALGHSSVSILSAEEVGLGAPGELRVRVDARDVAVARAAVSTPHTLALRRAVAPLFSWSPTLGGHVPSSKSFATALNGNAETLLALRSTGAALSSALFNASHVTPLVPALSVLAQILPRPAVTDNESKGIRSRFGSAQSLKLDRFGSNRSIPSTPPAAVSASPSTTDAMGSARLKKTAARDHSSTSTCLLWTWGGDAEWDAAQSVLRARGDALDALCVDSSMGGEAGFGFDSGDFGGEFSGGGSAVSVSSWTGSEARNAGSEADRAARLAASALDASLFLDAESARGVAALRGGAAAALSDTAERALQVVDFSPLDWLESITSAGGDQSLPCLSQIFRIVHDRTTPRALVDAALAVFRFWSKTAPERARQFLIFATGTPHLPSPLAELLRIDVVGLPPQSLAAANGVLRVLPTSHSCTNTIELPHYAAAVKLGARGQTAGVADSAALREWAAQDGVLAKREDFIDLVAVVEGRLRAAVEDGAAGGYTMDDL
jgi:hypothetical protein